MQKVLDWELATMQAGNDRETAELLCEKFLYHLPKSYGKIKDAYQGGDLENLALHIHSLLGATSYCGFPKLLSTLTEVDAYLADMQEKDPQSMQLPTLMEKLYTNIEEVHAVITEELAKI